MALKEKLSTYLDTDQIDRLYAVRARTRIPLSALVRDGVEMVLEKHGCPKPMRLVHQKKKPAPCSDRPFPVASEGSADA